MKAKKSLGQNFLTSSAAIFKIVSAGELFQSDTVLEIGPGRGALTSKLLETGATVICVEKDRELIPFLEEKFAEYLLLKKLILIEGDILDLSIEEILNSGKEPKNQVTENSKKINNYKLIANIPYYITGAIIRKFCEASHKPEIMILLVQKEVAERIVANDKKESILSISVKVYASANIVTKVSAGSFYPKPKVDSAVIRLSNIKTPFKYSEEEKIFFEILHYGFAHKRKLLIGNLKALSDSRVLNSNQINNLNTYINNNTNNKIRAEDMSVEDWLKILNHIVDNN